MADLTDKDKARRLNAKRFNKRTRLFVTLQNNTAIAIAVGAFVLPLANASGSTSTPHWIWLMASAILHMRAQISLGVLKSED